MALDQFTALIAIAPILVLFSFLNAKFKETVIAPIAGLRWSWEPRFLLRLRYTYGARQAFDDGYNKVTRLFTFPSFTRFIASISRLNSSKTRDSKS